MIIREKRTYIVKEIGNINLTQNCIYLNKPVKYTVIPFQYVGFLFHIILNDGSYFSDFIKESKLVDLPFLQKWSSLGTIILDLELNKKHILSQFSEDYSEYLHPRKRDALYIEKLHKNLSVLAQRSVSGYIYIAYSKKTLIYAKNIDYRGIWIDDTPKDPTIQKTIQEYVNNTKKEMFLKEKNKSIFPPIKEKKELRRKSKKEFKNIFFKGLKTNTRYLRLIESYGKELIEARLTEEMIIILNDGFGDYFDDFKIITDYLKNNNILFHLKGSGVGSLVLYIMSINNINPLQYQISFSRFLGNGKIADIDIDVPSDKKDKILDDLKILMKEKKGKDLYHILNISSSNFDKLVLHPTGILLEDKNIKDEIPLLVDGDRNVAQFFDSSSNPILEKVGYLKYDLINSVVLNEIQESFKDINIKGLLDDWETYIKWDPSYNKELLSGKFDYFQLNAAPIKRILREYPLQGYEDLCKMVAINRPAILRRYKHNEIIANLKGQFLCNDKAIQNIVSSSNTGAMIIYQDQAIDLLGYILPNVPFKERMDLVKGRGDIKTYEKAFKENCINLTGDKAITIYLWEGIRAFKEYGLNKAHAFSYGFIPLLQLYSHKK